MQLRVTTEDDPDLVAVSRRAESPRGPTPPVVVGREEREVFETDGPRGRERAAQAQDDFVSRRCATRAVQVEELSGYDGQHLGLGARPGRLAKLRGLSDLGDERDPRRQHDTPARGGARHHLSCRVDRPYWVRGKPSSSTSPLAG